MRHKASGPLINHWHRFRCSVARVLEVGAGNRPGRALVGLMAALALVLGGYITIAAATGGTSPEPVDTAAPPPAREAPTSDPLSPSPEPSVETPAVIGPSQPQTSEAEPTPSPSATFESETPEPTEPTQTETDPPSRAIPNPPTPTSSFNEPGDVKAPNTSLLQERPDLDAAQFTFSANEEATFTCSFDEAAFTACDSPMFFGDLKPGWHTFAVAATDLAGNTDPSPAQARWHVKKGPVHDE